MKKFITILSMIALILVITPAAEALSKDEMLKNYPLDRANFAYYLWEQAGSPEPESTTNPFSDIPADAYCLKAVLWATENKILSGIATNQFGPSDHITRAQAATVLYRLAGTPEVSVQNPYSDIESDRYYTDAVLWAYETDHIICDSATNNEFAPLKQCTLADLGLSSAYGLCLETEGTLPGTDISWVYNSESKKLVISGTGSIGNDWRNYECTYETEHIVIEEGITELGGGTFAPFEKVVHISLPNSMTSLGDNPFFGLKYLKTLQLPESITAIYAQDFFNCESLTSIYIPIGVTMIGAEAFDGCISLTDVYYGGTQKDWEQIDITYSHTYIDMSSNPVIEVENAPTNVPLKNATFHFDSTPPITGICGDDLTWELTKGGTLTVSGEGDMEDYATPSSTYSRSGDSTTPAPWSEYANDIRSVIVNPGVTSIGSAAFCNCVNLNKVSLPASVSDINNNAFANCSSIAGISIPEGVSTIGNNAFYNCSSLKAVSLPSTLTSLDASTFESCDNLKNIYFGGSQNSWEEITQDSQLVLPENASLSTSVPENPFSDVPIANYFYPTVLWAYEKGITSGRTETTFAPNDPCKRSEVVTFLHRAQGKPVPNSVQSEFTDVKIGKFYTDAVAWAVEKSVTQGMGDGTFGVDRECTRAQVVTFLWRTAGCPEPTSAEHPFTDLNPKGFYYKAVLWAVENGITSGMTATTFGVDNICTRGQIVTFLHRFAG